MNLDYLIANKIIFRRDPVNDTPDAIHAWGRVYTAGTYEYYDLFRYKKAMISSYKSFKWHLYVLWYLNPNMEVDDFYKLSEYLCNKHNKFIGFRYVRKILDSITDDVYNHCELDRAPPNILRKVIFNEFTGLTTKEKQSIVGRYTGKVKLTPLEIHNTMLYINNRGNKITISGLADELNRSTRTIHRNINEELKNLKNKLNEEYKTNS